MPRAVVEVELVDEEPPVPTAEEFDAACDVVRRYLRAHALKKPDADPQPTKPAQRRPRFTRPGWP